MSLGVSAFSLAAHPLAAPKAQAQAQVVTEWGAVGDLSPPDDLSGFVRGGREPDPTKWRASLYPKSGYRQCTSTLIGPEVLLTAAHCVQNGLAVGFKLGGSSYAATCQRAAAYEDRSDQTQDYALCKVAPAVTGIVFERMNVDPAYLALQQEVLLTGFGCTKEDGSGGNDNVYRIGESNISSLPAPGGNTIVASGRAALCFGDSGAAAFVMGPGDTRIVIGVNSKLDPDGGVALGKSSHLASTSSEKAQAFFATWRNENGKPKICGLTTAKGDAQCHI